MTITAKPHGPIPPEFAALRELPWPNVRTPAYVYDFAVVEARIARLRAALPAGIGIHYAIKANPFPPLLARIRLIWPLTDKRGKVQAQPWLNKASTPRRVYLVISGRSPDSQSAHTSARSIRLPT